MPSKSFRAVLASLEDEQLSTLRRWSADNCSHAVFVQEGKCVVWLSSRERPRTADAFMRSIRALFKRLSIDTSALRGRWLTPTTEDLVLSEAGAQAATVGTAAAPPHQQQSAAEGADECPGDSNEKVIVLSGARNCASRAGPK